MKNISTNTNLTNNTEQLPNPNDSIKSVVTRFGQIVIDVNKAINFPSGLLGIPGNKYCLANFPNEAFTYFKVLQSLDNDDLAFLIYPLAAEGDGSNYSLLSFEDLESCSQDLDIPIKTMLILLITSVHQLPNPHTNNIETSITVNLRAPLIIDTRNNLGIQYVFHNEKYKIRHVIYEDK